MTLGNKIYHYRKQINLSQEELAHKLNVTRQSVSLWENDLSLPSIDNLKSLSNLFNISIDELLANKQESVECNDKKPLFTTNIKYNYDVYKNMYHIVTKKHVLINIICIFLCIFIICGILISKTVNNVCLIFPLFFMTIVVINLVKIKVGMKKYVYNCTSTKPNLESVQMFYEDYMIINSTCDTSKATTTKKYNEIKNKYQDDNYIYLVFNDLSTIINKSTYEGNVKDILAILGFNDKIIKESKSTKIVSLILFILSFASIALFVLIIGIIIRNQPIPEFPSLMPSFMWIAFIILLLPLASLIFGIILTAKKRKYKKNIVSGAIMSIILCIYGCFYFIFEEPIVNDYTYLQTLSNQVGIDFPSNGYLLVSYDEIQVESFAMYKPNDKDVDEFVYQLNNNNNFKNDISFIPTNTLSTSVLSNTINYDYFAIYNLTTNKFSEFNGKLIYLAYDIETSVMYIAYL